MSSTLLEHPQSPLSPKRTCLRVLVLGGTRFVGRAVVGAATYRSHEVTVFNRGLTNPDLFPAVEKLRGDRASDLSALTGRRWDAVIDVAAYDPAVVRRSVDDLSESVDRYVFVSSLSVYADQSTPHDEDWPRLTLGTETEEADLYGARKAASEDIVLSSFGKRALIARAGMIVGPFDPTDRFTYWPRRLAAGGRVLAPGNPGDPLQFIDVRDLAEWMVRSIENGVAGTYNATGEQLAFSDFIQEAVRLTNSEATVVWVPSEQLHAFGVDPWMGVPLWIAAPGWQAANRVDVGRARSAGLTFRPLATTITDARIWDQERRSNDNSVPVGLSIDREGELLDLADQIGAGRDTGCNIDGQGNADGQLAGFVPSLG